MKKSLDMGSPYTAPAEGERLAGLTEGSVRPGRGRQP